MVKTERPERESFKVLVETRSAKTPAKEERSSDRRYKKCR